MCFFYIHGKHLKLPTYSSPSPCFKSFLYTRAEEELRVCGRDREMRKKGFLSFSSFQNPFPPHSAPVLAAAAFLFKHTKIRNEKLMLRVSHEPHLNSNDQSEALEQSSTLSPSPPQQQKQRKWHFIKHSTSLFLTLAQHPATHPLLGLENVRK